MRIEAIPTTFQCLRGNFHQKCNSICYMDFVGHGMFISVFDPLNLHAKSLFGGGFMQGDFCD